MKRGSGWNGDRDPPWLQAGAEGIGPDGRGHVGNERVRNNKIDAFGRDEVVRRLGREREDKFSCNAALRSKT